MTKHPLTDEMCEVIATGNQWSGDIGDVVFRHSDMRATYDLAIDHFSKWIYENGAEYFIQHHEHNIQTDLDTIIADFRKSMRPQQQQ